MNNTSPPPVMSIKQAAEYLGVSQRAMYGLVRSGEIPASKVGETGRTWRITKNHIDEYLEVNRYAV